jgi:signal transduction histidine kinase
MLVIFDATSPSSTEQRKMDIDLLRAVVPQTDLVVWIVTSELSTTYISPNYDRLFPGEQVTLLKTPSLFLDHIHPDDRERVRQIFTGAAFDGEQRQVTMNERVEVYRILKSKSSVQWIRDRIVTLPVNQPIVNTTKDLSIDLSFDSLANSPPEASIGQIEIVHIMEDITLEQQTQLELQQDLQQQQEINALRSRFIAMTSHEFRTPLTVIASSVSILQEYGDRLAEDKQKHHLHRIQTKVNQIVHWLDQALLINQLDINQFQFNPIPIDLVQFCARLVEETQLSTTQHRLQFSAHPNGLINQVDETLLGYILTNLLNNSIKCSPSGGVIQFKLTCQQDLVEFVIEDNGIGIPEAEQAQIFDLFYRASNARHLSGTGVGLAIVKKCVELHQGCIYCHSQEGTGTTFAVSIPRNYSAPK